MTLTVDYQPFSNGSGANVESQAQFLTDLGSGGSLANGFQTGLAKSTQFNKVLRQSSMVSAAVANFVAIQLNTNILDDGNLTTLVTNFTNALISLIAANAPTSNIYLGSAGGTANALTFTPSPAVTALSIGTVTYVGLATAANTGAVTVNISGLGAKSLLKDGPTGLTALTGGELQNGEFIVMRWDGTQLQLGGTGLGALAFLGIGAGLKNDGSNNLALDTGHNNDWTNSVQYNTFTALSSGVAADFTTHQSWQAAPNGATFTISNPSAAITGARYTIRISYTTSNAVAWGSNFKGLTYLNFTNTAGAVDIVTFEFNGSTFELWGFSMNAGA